MPPSAPVSPPSWSVKKFGAKGDGITDDTKAVQAAFDAAAKAQTNGLYFPAGKYLLSSTISGGNSAGMRVRGAGISRTILACGHSGIGLAWTNPVSYSVDSLSIAELSIIGPGKTTPSIGIAIGAYGPQFGFNAQNITLDHVALSEWGIASAWTNVWLYSFDSCVISNAVEGLRFAGCHAGTVRESFFVNTWGTAGGTAIGYHLPMNLGSGDNAKIDSCLFFSWTNAIYNEELSLLAENNHTEYCGELYELHGTVRNTILSPYIFDPPNAWDVPGGLINADSAAIGRLVIINPFQDGNYRHRTLWNCIGGCTIQPILLGLLP